MNTMPEGEKKENRGGARPGSGPKKTTRQISDTVKNNYIKAARKIAKETGMPVEEHYLRMSIDPNIQDSVRQGFAKLYNEEMLVKESEQTINDRRSGPTIGLPPTMVKPKTKEQEEEHPRLHG